MINVPNNIKIKGLASMPYCSEYVVKLKLMEGDGDSYGQMVLKFNTIEKVIKAIKFLDGIRFDCENDESALRL